MSTRSHALSLPSGGHLAGIATASLVGIAYFAVTIVALHVLRSGDDPIRQPTSEYAVGEYGYLMTTAFLSVSLASLALLIGLHQGIAASARSRAGLALLGVWSVGVLIAMIFPIDLDGAPRTTAGTIHQINGPVTFLCLCLGALLVSRGLNHDERWRSIRPVALILSACLLPAFVLTGVSAAADTGLAGLFQRVVLTIFVTWFVLIATRLRAIAHGLERVGADEHGAVPTAGHR